MDTGSSSGDYRACFHASAQAMALAATASGRLVAVNAAWLQATGTARDDVLGRTVAELGLAATPLVLGDGSQTLWCLDAPPADGDVALRQQAEEALRQSEQQFRCAFDGAPTGMSIVGPDGVTYLAVNPLLCEMLGYTREEFLGNSIGLVTHPDDEAASQEWIRQRMNGEPCEPYLEKRYLRKDGSVVWGQVWAQWIHNPDGSRRMAIAHIVDVTERKRAEEALAAETTRRRVLFEQSPDGIVVIDPPTARFLEFNAAAHRQLGYTREEFARLSIFEVEAVETAAQTKEHIAAVMRTGQADFETLQRTRDGELRHIHVTAQLLDVAGQPVYHCIWRDITDRKRAEEERGRLLRQLSQAQRMEAVGRLAGGVAHDFNNMLTVILGQAELCLEDLAPSHPLREALEEIEQAAMRSASLTRQLLAFARQQTVAPRVIDLNDTVEPMLKMLKRLIGEDIELLWLPGHDVGPVKMDPSQIDQMLANLCVNARDAIGPAGGKVTIETSPTEFDLAYCAEHEGAVPGEYATLAVSDDGSGMDQATLASIFEPFFTTKEMGRGTGLGLATIYGIVKQNDGYISVDSEPGHGTTFRIHLPRYQRGPLDTAEHGAHAGPRGQETILLVEDERAILHMTRAMLQRQGYAVLTAASPEDAVATAQSHAGGIDLLMTDVIMPQMTGRELAALLTAHRPGLKTLYMSGYTASVIAHHGVLEPGVHFIQKPFSRDVLATQVRAALDEP